MAERKKRAKLVQGKLSFGRTSSAAGPSQQSGSSQSATTGLSDDEIDRLVNDTVFYLLISDQHKKAIKKSDIKKHVLQDNGKAMRTVLTTAKEKLEHVFGYELVELDDKQGSVILVNKMDLSEHRDFLQRSEKELARQGLITIVLTLILMSDGVVSEDKLWKLLKPLGLAPDTNDPTFGNVGTLIKTELVSEAYLKFSAIPGTCDPVEYEYHWGARAHKEASKEAMLKMFCKITGQQPEDWRTIYEEVARSE